MLRVHRASVLFSGCLLAACAWGSDANPAEIPSKAFGGYALSDGRRVNLVSSGDGALDYVLSDGTYGTLHRQTDGSFAPKSDPGHLVIRFQSEEFKQLWLKQLIGPPVAGARIPYRVEEVSFDSKGVQLQGRLVKPAAGTPKAAIVLVDGSGSDSAIETDFWQFELPARGIAYFVFDKRGTGRSKGNPTANFDVRADDTMAAVKAARQLLKDQRVLIGLMGDSQGGWVAPLTASRVQPAVDFLIVGYGSVEPVTAEDRDEVLDDLRTAGYGEPALTQALEITDSTARIVRSHWTEGYEEFEAVRAKYKDAPWIKALNADQGYTGALLGMSVDDIKKLGPQTDQGLSFDYEPLPVVSSLVLPQLWLLGGSDTSLPSARTLQLLREMQAHKPQLTVVLFPRAEHGIVEKWQDAIGLQKRYSEGYFDAITRWATDRTLPPLQIPVYVPSVQAPTEVSK